MFFYNAPVKVSLFVSREQPVVGVPVFLYLLSTLQHPGIWQKRNGRVGEGGIFCVCVGGGGGGKGGWTAV